MILSSSVLSVVRKMNRSEKETLIRELAVELRELSVAIDAYSPFMHLTADDEIDALVWMAGEFAELNAMWISKYMNLFLGKRNGPASNQTHDSPGDCRGGLSGDADE